MTPINKNIKVSVTIPVYNTSNYLRKCLDSLLAQTLKEIEFIVIDDGSTDESGKICDEYGKKDSRFKIIHKSNGGSASARQAGLNMASGDYIIVCDSDDWVEPDMYEKLYVKAAAMDADIVTCGYFAEYPDGKSIAQQYWFNEKNGIVDNEDFLTKGAGSSWIKLIKKSLFEKARATYEPGVNLSEDALILYKLMKGNPKVVQIEGNYYHYIRQYGGSSYTNSIKMTHINQLLFTYNWLKENYKDSRYTSLIHKRAIDLAFAYLRAKDTDSNSMRLFLKSELPWKQFGNSPFTPKKIVAYIEKLLPLSISKTILKLVYPIIYK